MKSLFHFPRRRAPASQAFLSLLSAAFCVFCGLSLQADSLTQLKWQIDTARPIPHTLELYRGETVYLIPQYLNNNTIQNLSDCTNVVLRYKDATLTNAFYSISGSVYSASNGQVRVTWSPTNEAASTLYDYTLAANVSNGSILRAYGQILLRPTVSGLATNCPYVYSALDGLSNNMVALFGGASTVALSNNLVSMQAALSNNVVAIGAASVGAASNNVLAQAASDATGKANGVSNNLVSMQAALSNNVVAIGAASVGAASNNIIAQAQASVSESSAAASNAFLRVAGGNQMTAPLEFAEYVGAPISGAVAIVRSGYLEEYWADNIWRVMGYHSPWTGGLGSGIVALYRDWTGFNFRTNLIGSGNETLSGFNYSGNGAGLTNGPWLTSTSPQATNERTPTAASLVPYLGTNDSRACQLSGLNVMSGMVVNASGSVGIRTNNAGNEATLNIDGDLLVCDKTLNGITTVTIKAGPSQSNNRTWNVQDASGNPVYETVDLGGGMQFSDGSRHAGILGSHLRLSTLYGLLWSSTTTIAGTPDTGIFRTGAGALAIGNSSQGDMSGSLTVSNLTTKGTTTLCGTTTITNGDLTCAGNATVQSNLNVNGGISTNGVPVVFGGGGGGGGTNYVTVSDPILTTSTNGATTTVGINRPTFTNAAQAAASMGLSAFISGAWCDYLNTTQVWWNVTNGLGQGMCADKAWAITTPFTSTVTSLAGASTTPRVQYAYLTYAALPTIIVYWSTNEPTYSTTWQGYYCPTSLNDRVISSVLSTNSATILPVFARKKNGGYVFGELFLLQNGNPSGAAWQATDVNLATLTPVGATEVYLTMYCGANDGLNINAAMCTLEDSAVLGLSQSADGLHYLDIPMYHANGQRMVGGKLALGTSRQIVWFGDDAQNNITDIRFNQWAGERR